MTLNCTFCTKPEQDVVALLAFPDDIFICDECVSLMDETIATGDEGWRDQQVSKLSNLKYAAAGCDLGSDSIVRSRPLSIVIRIYDVTISRPQLEAALGLSLDGYELTSGEATHYAQIDIADETDYWSSTLNTIQALGHAVEPLVAAGSIGSPSIDVALALPDDVMWVSSTIPSTVAEAAGRLGMDIDLSIYRVGSPEG